jgi:hypothetical protein
MKALPHAHRPQGAYLWLVLAVCTIGGAIAVLSSISGLGLLE